MRMSARVPQVHRSAYGQPRTESGRHITRLTVFKEVGWLIEYHFSPVCVSKARTCSVISGRLSVNKDLKQTNQITRTEKNSIFVGTKRSRGRFLFGQIPQYGVTTSLWSVLQA